jgi:hypothetical protein
LLRGASLPLARLIRLGCQGTEHVWHVAPGLAQGTSPVFVKKREQNSQKGGRALHQSEQYTPHPYIYKRRRSKLSAMPVLPRHSFWRILCRDSVFPVNRCRALFPSPCYLPRHTFWRHFLPRQRLSADSPPGASVIVNFYRDTVLVSFSAAVST